MVPAAYLQPQPHPVVETRPISMAKCTWLQLERLFESQASFPLETSSRREQKPAPWPTLAGVSSIAQLGQLGSPAGCSASCPASRPL